MSNLKINRILSLDVLRVLGTFFIIVAHARPSDLVFQLRTFDVPLLVFVSGISFTLSNRNLTTLKNFSKYVLKRFKRLVIPTWIFLIAYYVVFLIIILLTKNNNISINIIQILTAFSLISGFGYVWIIRVYFLMALFAPMLIFFKNLFSKKFIFFFFIFANIFFSLLLNFHLGIFNLFNAYFLLYIIGYGFIYFIRIIYQDLNKFEKILLFLTMFIFTIICILLNKSFNPQNYKYPPTQIYLTYGTMSSIILYEIINTKYINIFFDNKFIKYTSKYSLEIYFIHIFAVQFLEYNILHLFINNFYTRFIFITSFTALFILLYMKIELILKSKFKLRVRG